MKRSVGSLLGLGIVLAISSAVYASTFKVIYTFGSSGPSDAGLPQGGLIRDAAGNLYGTTVGGGEHGSGTIFELSLGSNGPWTEQILYSFTGLADGGGPVAGVVFDSEGNLYGTTQQGGIVNQSCSVGCGVVFQLSPSESGWTEKVLYSFTGGADGATPDDPLVLDSAGNLYGTTYNGGSKQFCSYGCGVAFELIKATGSSETILHTFGSFISKYYFDGTHPAGALAFYGKGKLVGTTASGGDGSGTVFGLTLKSNETWGEQIIHNFCSPADCTDGSSPQAGLLVRNGKLYGTTINGGGAAAYGTIYELAEATSGWQLSEFSFGGPDGAVPVAPVIFRSGETYGATEQGGIKNNACPLYTEGNGVLYQVTQAGTKLGESVLYEFTGGNDGCGPSGALLADPSGNLYGTTFQGGAFGEGVVFEVTP